jgi:hypothetical protein
MSAPRHGSLPRIAAIAALLGVLALHAASSRAQAHSWYPRFCCNELDCMVVEKLTRNPDGSMLMEAGPITVLVPRDFQIDPSQDRQAHVCVYRDVRGKYHPRCVFLPGEA